MTMNSDTVSKILLIVFFLSTFQTRNVEAQAGYVTSDFHQHTTYTDGSYSFGKMMEMNNHFGLDWWVFLQVPYLRMRS